MAVEIAGVRTKLQEHEMVTRTWFEWELKGGQQLKTLVIEVAFDTDPNSSSFSESALEDIERIARDASENTTMVWSNVRIVPEGTG